MTSNSIRSIWKRGRISVTLFFLFFTKESCLLPEREIFLNLKRTFFFVYGCHLWSIMTFRRNREEIEKNLETYVLSELEWMRKKQSSNIREFCFYLDILDVHFLLRVSGGTFSDFLSLIYFQFCLSFHEKRN